MKTLLVVWYSRSGASEALASELAIAAQTEFESSASPQSGTVVLRKSDTVTTAELLGASAYVFVCPENLGSMAGSMKEFFDRNYYAALDRLNGRPYQAIVSAGSDGAGAVRQLERIANGWRLRKIGEALVVNVAAQTPAQILAPKKLTEAQLSAARDLGRAFAAGLVLGVY